MDLQVKKLLLKSSYLKLEKEEVIKACIEADKDINIHLKENYPEEYKKYFEINNEQENQTIRMKLEEAETDEEPYESTQQIKNKDVKKLYRKIVEKTHPDKTGNNFKSDIFCKASLAYEENNLMVLLDIAGSLNLEITSLSPEAIALLKQNIEELSEEISQKTKTVAWAWHNAKTDEERKTVIVNLLKHRGVL